MLDCEGAMSISITCRKCDRKLRVADTAQGKTVKCPNCGTLIRVQAAEAEDTDEVAGERVRSKPDRDPSPAARALPANAVRQDEDEEDDPRARMARGKARRFEDDEDDADEGRMRKPKRRGVLPAPLGLRITVIVLAILAGLASAGLGVAGILAKAKETEDVDQN